MSDTQHTDIPLPTIRRTVSQTLTDADAPPTRSALVESVADATGAAESVVSDQVDTLEREGFVYLVGDRDGDPEVKQP